MVDIQQGRQVVMDRLKRRLDNYRNHNNISSHHFETTVDTIYSDQRKQTQVLKQRHIESKVKKTSKKASDNKKQDTSLLANMGQSKLLARTHDQTTGPGDNQDNEPSAKKQRLMNGSLGSSSNSDISDFQIVQQLHNLKNNVSSQSSGVSNISTSTLPCSDSIEGLAESALCANESDDIKKESDIDLPNDSLLDDLGELGNFEDMDMGINLADFVQDLDLDNIKHENSNPGIDSYFKEELDIPDAFYDDPSNISSDSGVAVSNNSGGQLTTTQSLTKMNTNLSTSTHCQFSNTPSSCHTSLTPPSSYASCSYPSSIAQTTYTSVPSTSSSNYQMSSSLNKIRMNVNNIPMGQSDMALAAQTLKQMAEQHQTKLSPTGNPVRPNLGGDFGYNNMPGATMMSQGGCVPNQMYNNTLNQGNAMYNQNMVGNDVEMKRRHQMMHQYSLQQTNMNGPCNPQMNQGMASNQTQSQSQNQQKPVQQQTPPNQHIAQGQSQQVQQQATQQTQPQQQSQPNAQQQTSQGQQSQQMPQNQSNSNQSSQLSNSISPFSNRMSPMSSYPHVSQPSNQMGMNPQYSGNICGGMTGGIRGSYPTPTRGSSPIPSGPQGPQSTMQNANQPQCYMQQPMMGNVGMMRPQMMANCRPPPPEYRQAQMLQQHQAIMGQPMNQNMSQMHQGMNQISYQNMRPGFRPSMTGSPMGSMGGGQMMGQQSIPANMKGNMVPSNNMNIPVTMAPSMGQGNVGPTGGMPMNQVAGGGNMGMVNARPTMMQRTRAPNVNMTMSGMGMGTQMPPSRPEWRQMIMQQGQGGMIMGPIRHGYQQPQQGTMMNQAGQLIPMQRSQPHMMGMMNMQAGPNMQHAPGMTSGGNAMQGNGSIPSSMHSNPAMQHTQMTMGGRMQTMAQQGQIRMGMQINPQAISDSRTPPNMASNQTVNMQIGSTPGNMQMTSAGGNMQMSGAGGNMGHHGNSIPQMGNNVTNMNSGTNINMVQGNGPQVNAMNPNHGGGNTMALHPRSPATMGQMHPCSPANVNQGGPSRPLSNPGVVISTSQNQTGTNCPQSVSNSGSPMMPCSTPQSQIRQMGGNVAPIGRSTTNPIPQGHSTQNMGNLSQGQNQSLIGGGNSGLQNNTSGVLINKNVNNVVSSVGNNGQRPDSRGGGGGSGGCSVMKTSQPSTPNPPSSSGSNDFDLIFNNEGEFASLLH